MSGLLSEHFFETTVSTSAIAFTHRPRLRTKHWSYGKIAKIAFQFARELESRGIGQGDRVILWGENSPEWVAAFFGMIVRGASAVPLDEQSAPDFVQRVCQRISPKLILSGSDSRKDSILELELFTLVE